MPRENGDRHGRGGAPEARNAGRPSYFRSKFGSNDVSPIGVGAQLGAVRCKFASQCSRFRKYEAALPSRPSTLVLGPGR